MPLVEYGAAENPAAMLGLFGKSSVLIDATASLAAAEGLPAAALQPIFGTKGWAARPSGVDGVAIISKRLPKMGEPVQLLLPVSPGFSDEQRRVADVLRAIEVLEGRSLAEIVNDVRLLMARPQRADVGTVEAGFAEPGPEAENRPDE